MPYNGQCLNVLFSRWKKSRRGSFTVAPCCFPFHREAGGGFSLSPRRPPFFFTGSGIVNVQLYTTPMKLLDLFRRNPRPMTAEEKATFSLRSSNLPLRDFILALGGTPEDKPEGREYSASVWVYACLNQWAQLACVPWQIMRGEGDDSVPVDSGPAYFLLTQPNSKMTSAQFWELSILHLGLYGEYFHLKEDGMKTTGIPTFLTAASPANVKIEEGDIDSMGKQTHWTIEYNKKRKRVPVEGVIHNYLPNPYNARRGLAPLSALRLTVDADFAARLHNRAQMENRGRVEAIVSYDQSMNEEELRTYAKMWEKQFGGSSNAGKVAHLSGVQNFQQLSQSMKDLDWLEGQKIGREEICAAYGIPPNMVGILDHATFSNYEQAARSLWTETLIPLGKRIESSVNREIVKPFIGQDAAFAFDFQNNVPALAENTSEKIEQYVSLVSDGRLSPVQASTVVGLDIGETEPIQSEVLVPFNLVPAEALEDDGEGNTADPVEPQQNELTPELIADKAAEILVKREKQQAKTERIEKAKAERVERLRAALWRAVIAGQEPLERQAARILKKYFFEQRSAALNALNEWTTANLKGFDPKERQPITDASGRELVVTLFDDEEWNQELKKRMDPVLTEAVVAALGGIASELATSADDFDATLMNAFRSSQDEILGNVNETTKARLVAVADVLREGIEQDLSTDDIAANMADKLRGVFNLRESERARIARTEVGRTFSASRYQAMKAAGIQEKMWLSSRDPVVRDSHVSTDGQKRGIDDTFGNGLLYPHDPNGPAKETINCRCTLVPLFGDERDQDILWEDKPEVEENG